MDAAMKNRFVSRVTRLVSTHYFSFDRLQQIVTDVKNGYTVWEDLFEEISSLEEHVCKATSQAATIVKQKTIVQDGEIELHDNDDNVPDAVKEWLSETFARPRLNSHQPNKRKLKHVAHAIRAGIMVDKLFKRMSSLSVHIPSEVYGILKGQIDRWDFDVFSVAEQASFHTLSYVGCYIFQSTNLSFQFRSFAQLSTSRLDAFFERITAGYTLHNNPYHNDLHAADVTQTLFYFLQHGDCRSWLSDVEFYAAIFSAIVHDVEHTGTTNNFHISTKSSLALTYNDRSILENYHVTTAFRIMEDDSANITATLSPSDYKVFRATVIDMVLATDMTFHFSHIKKLKSLLASESELDRVEILSFLLHAADIAHPAKPFALHERWVDILFQEFFEQGDRERQLGLSISPLCDRHTTLIPASQVGFIDFIVSPSIALAADLMDGMLDRQGSDSDTSDGAAASPRTSRRQSTQLGGGGGGIKRSVWLTCIDENKSRWQADQRPTEELVGHVTSRRRRSSSRTTLDTVNEASSALLPEPSSQLSPEDHSPSTSNQAQAPKTETETSPETPSKPISIASATRIQTSPTKSPKKSPNTSPKKSPSNCERVGKKSPSNSERVGKKSPNSSTDRVGKKSLPSAGSTPLANGTFSRGRLQSSENVKLKDGRTFQLRTMGPSDSLDSQPSR